MWRRDTISTMQAVIRAEHIALMIELYGEDVVLPEDRAFFVEAVDGGLVEPPEAAGVFIDAWRFGAWLAREPEAAAAAETHEDVIERAPDLTPWEREMAAAARAHGAALVVGLGNKVSADLTTVAIEADREQARRLKTKIAETVAEGIEDRLTVGQVKGRIGDALGGDWARDLGRIAATETQRAVNEGYATALEADFGGEALCAVIPQPSACKVCLRHYIDPATGRPRIFKVAELPPSSVNYKVKVAEQVPCKPPAHPWCHCQLVHVAAGWGFDENWVLRPPGASAVESPDPVEG